MANVNIKFNNKDYLLSCDEGQEESLKKLTTFLDKKYNELKDQLGNIGENKLLLITTIKLIDDYFNLKKKVTLKKNYKGKKTLTLNPLRGDFSNIIFPPCDFIISDVIDNPRPTLDFESPLLLLSL